jgi:hypothetical protein
MVSIIIPAHNEERVISRCLAALLSGAEPGELEIVVVCNACTDGTAEKARAFGDAVHVAEIEEKSKTAALNVGDQVAQKYPRIYLDADVVFPLSGVRRLASALKNGTVALASPVLVPDLSASSSPVQAFYAIWTHLPYNQVMVGTGVYALSEKARSRFGKFPSIIADDGFVRTQFLPEERMAVPEASVTVAAPRTLPDLVRVKTRCRIGAYQLGRRFPSAHAYDDKRCRAIVASFPWTMRLPWQLLIYLTVNVIVRIRARRHMRRTDSYNWERDDRSRL